MIGKKYWTTEEAKKGYSLRKAPALKPAVSFSEHSGGAKQSVKGKQGSSAKAEAKGAAGRKQ